MKRKEIFINILIGICGIIALWIVISHIAHFEYPDYFYNKNPNIDSYVGINVVSPFADFSFFTYLTMIIFGSWCILFSLSQIFKLEKLNNFLRARNLVCFIYCNYIVTITLYTLFELCSGNPTFGWFGNYPNSWHSLATGIISHYILFIFATIIFAKIKVADSKNKPYYLCIAGFLLTYYTMVKITGEFAYNIRWFPYVIFDAKSFGNMLGVSNYSVSVVLLVVSCILLFFLYFTLYTLLIKGKSKNITLVADGEIDKNF